MMHVMRAVESLADMVVLHPKAEKIPHSMAERRAPFDGMMELIGRLGQMLHIVGEVGVFHFIFDHVLEVLNLASEGVGSWNGVGRITAMCECLIASNQRRYEDQKSS